MVKNLENGIARIDRKVYEGLFLEMIATYKYFNNNEVPEKLVIPGITEVDGIPIVIEEAIKTVEVADDD